MPRLSRLSPDEVEHGAAHVGMLLEQIEKRYSADMYSPNMAAAFVLFLIKEAEQIDVDNLSVFLKEQKHDKQITEWIKMHIEDHWDDFRRLIAMLPVEWLREYLVTHQPTDIRDSWFGTPDCLCDLAIGLLKEFGGNDVLNPCCGIGNFMVRLKANGVHCDFTGHDLSDRCVCISKIRAYAQGCQSSISVRNTLEGEAGALGNFDFIFLNPPFGQRLTHIHMFFNNQEGTLPPAYPMVKSTNSTEWIWASKMLDALRENGHIAIILTNGALFNMTEAPIRQYLVDRGYIDAVIALPERMLNYSNINLSLVILSKERSEFVRMINATKLYERGARVNVMTPLHISTVIDAFNSESEFRKDISIAEIAKNNYQMAVQKYFMPKIKVRNGMPLRDLCVSITRGSGLSRDELHEKFRDVDSGVRCLNITNIQDGAVDDDMPFIDGISTRDEKYLVKTGDVVMTKAMAPYKVAVMEVPEGARVLATANFYILRLKHDLIDPYFLTAYLRSEAGKIQMEQVATGTTIRTIVQGSLEKIMIPMAPIEQQRRFAESYRQKLLNLATMRKEYDNAKKELDNAYDKFEKETLSK